MEKQETITAGPVIPPLKQPSPESGFSLNPIDVAATVSLLESFYDEDEAEQRETWETLKRALEEERP
ncbi:MAG: hypothetical protein U0Z53_20690 [Blastocatellia bacterium]